MKKLTLMAIAMGMLAFTACTEKKPAAAPATRSRRGGYRLSIPAGCCW